MKTWPTRLSSVLAEANLGLAIDLYRLEVGFSTQKVLRSQTKLRGAGRFCQASNFFSSVSDMCAEF